MKKIILTICMLFSVEIYATDTFMEMCENPTASQEITLNALTKEIFGSKENFTMGCEPLYKDLNRRIIVYVRGGKVSDLSPLKYFVQLKEINAKNNKIVDLSPLLNLINLEELVLRGNEIVDMSPLNRLGKLKLLNVGNNKIVNIKAISNLDDLEVLWMSMNKVSDFSSLKNLRNLKTKKMGQALFITAVKG